jgi:LPS O-antigen subunit length determinant protein (WzzB/FepE family)
MTPEEKKARIDELTRTLAYANSLGVRAAVVGDAQQSAEAARIYREAKEELSMLCNEEPTP